MRIGNGKQSLAPLSNDSEGMIYYSNVLVPIYIIHFIRVFLYFKITDFLNWVGKRVKTKPIVRKYRHGPGFTILIKKCYSSKGYIEVESGIFNLKTIADGNIRGFWEEVEATGSRAKGWLPNQTDDLAISKQGTEVCEVDTILSEIDEDENECTYISIERKKWNNLFDNKKNIIKKFEYESFSLCTIYNSSEFLGFHRPFISDIRGLCSKFNLHEPRKWTGESRSHIIKISTVPCGTQDNTSNIRRFNLDSLPRARYFVEGREGLLAAIGKVNLGVVFQAENEVRGILGVLADIYYFTRENVRITIIFQDIFLQISKENNNI